MGSPGSVAAMRARLTCPGIGRSTALLFAAEGAKVVVSDLDEQKAQKVVDEIKANGPFRQSLIAAHSPGGQAIAVGGDVTAEDFPKRLIGKTVEAFGDIHQCVRRRVAMLTPAASSSASKADIALF